MDQLTPEEKEVVRLLPLSIRQGALRLGIPEGTLKNKRVRVYQKIAGRGSGRFHRKTSVLMLALREGVIKFDELVQPVKWYEKRSQGCEH